MRLALCAKGRKSCDGDGVAFDLDRTDAPCVVPIFASQERATAASVGEGGCFIAGELQSRRPISLKSRIVNISV